MPTATGLPAGGLKGPQLLDWGYQSAAPVTSLLAMKRRLGRVVSIIFSICLMALVLACGQASEPPPSAAPATPAPAPPPPPTTGTVEGQMVGRKSGKPLGGQLVVLCHVAADPTCNLRTTFQATTDDAGGFSIRNVAPGRYAVGYTKRSETAIGKLKDSDVIDPTEGPGTVLSGTVVDIAGPSKLANVRGAVTDGACGLTFDFDNGKLFTLEVRAGDVTRADVKGWGQ